MNMNHNPMISIDTKKKEVLGQLTRNQPVLSKGNKAPDVYDRSGEPPRLLIFSNR
jgi:hypothetical protein